VLADLALVSRQARKPTPPTGLFMHFRVARFRAAIGAND
jgi:hypothetical protein